MPEHDPPLFVEAVVNAPTGVSARDELDPYRDLPIVDGAYYVPAESRPHDIVRRWRRLICSHLNRPLQAVQW